MIKFIQILLVSFLMISGIGVVAINDIDTICLYVGSAISSAIGDDIISKGPRRLIFSPGAENPDLLAKAKENGILTVNGCTLVMLNSGQF